MISEEKLKEIALAEMTKASVLKSRQQQVLNDNQVTALASKRIVNVSFMESIITIVNDLSNRKRLPLNVRKPLERIHKFHYEIHGKLTLDKDESFKIQQHLSKIMSKEVNHMLDSFGRNAVIPLEKYLLICIELINPAMKSIMSTDIKEFYTRTRQAELVDFSPLITSMNSFINAGNQYLYKNCQVNTIGI